MASSDLLTDPLLAPVPVVDGMKTLGGVALRDMLGQGGMGAVYRGRHPRLEVDVAVKVMTPPPGLSSDVPGDEAGSYVKRFIREARTAAKIDHANLVRVFDVDEEHGLYFIVMQYVEGETAAERLARKGPLSEGEAGRIALAAATGLAEAHRKGIVHRDVKPANILIDRSGKVKVADLGLAKAYADETETGEPSKITGTQAAIGTPHYMSPEQFASAEVGPASDVWSLGVTLYELLTGRLPWEADSVFVLANKVMNEPLPDPRTLRADLLQGVCGIVAKALAKDPAQRYGDCKEMGEVLREHVRAGLASAATGQPRPKAALPKPPTAAVTPPPDRTRTLMGAAELRDSTAPVAMPPPKRLRWLVPAAIAGGVVLLLTAMVALLAGGGPEEQTKHAPRETDAKTTDGRAEPERASEVMTARESLSKHDPTSARRQAEEERAANYRKWMDKAFKLELAGKLAEAARAYDEAAKYAPSGLAEAGAYAKKCRQDLFLREAEMAESKGYLDIAITSYQEAGKLGARVSGKIRSLRARTHVEEGDAKRRNGELDGAIRDFDIAIQIDPTAADAYARRGLVKTMKRDLHGAISDCDKAILLDRNYAYGYYVRGSAKSRNRDHDGAIRDLEKALSLEPNFAEASKMLSSAYGHRGIMRQDNDPNGAIRDFDKALEHDPRSSVVYCMRGVAKDSKQDRIGAMRDYNTAIELDANNGLAYQRRGRLKFLDGDISDAIQDYDRALQINPKDARSHWFRAFAKEKTGDYAAAIRGYDAAIRLEPRNAQYYFFRGSAKEATRNVDGAIQDYQKTIQLDPNHADARRNLAAIQDQQKLTRRLKAESRKKEVLRQKWRRLQKGMSKAQVRALLGEPAKLRVSMYVETWNYAPSGYVLFNKEGVYAWGEPSW